MSLLPSNLFKSVWKMRVAYGSALLLVAISLVTTHTRIQHQITQSRGFVDGLKRSENDDANPTTIVDTNNLTGVYQAWINNSTNELRQLEQFQLFLTLIVLVSVVFIVLEPMVRTIRRQAADLEQQNFELSRSKDTAEHANHVKGVFLATMSHELRTPMHGVLGMTELMLNTELTAQQRNYVEGTQESAEVLLGLLNDILDFSKIEAGMLEFESVEFDLIEVVEKVVHFQSHRTQGNDVELSCAIDPAIPKTLIGDPLRLTQVLANLIGNGIKFTKRGRVEVEVIRAVSKNAESERLQFRVKDTGIGIPEAKMKSIFEAFQQADLSTTREYGGTGLGLTISSQLVARMGGELQVRSQVGRGSTFFFDASFRTASKSREKEASILNEKRILLVDSSRESRSNLSEILQGWGAEVLAKSDLENEFMNGGQKRLSCDAAVISVSKKVEDILPLVERLRGKRNEAGQPIESVLVLPQSTTELDRIRNDVAVLSRPLRRHKLRAALERILNPELATQATRSRRRESRCLNIVLAEDNLVGQRVVTGLLEQVGHRVLLAKNGEEAIELNMHNRPDVILMDVHMPKLGGLDATRRIRESEAGTDDRVPIIALTAGASGEEKRACVEAGMDAFLSKPLRPRGLLKMIDHVLSQAQVANGSGDGIPPDNPLMSELDTGEWHPAPVVNETDPNRSLGLSEDRPVEVPATSSTQLMDEDGPFYSMIDQRVGLEQAGSESLFRSLVQAFITEAPNLNAAIVHAIQEGDWDTVKLKAHSLKGAAGFIGAMPVVQLAEELELAAKEQSIEQAELLLDPLVAGLVSIHREASGILELGTSINE